MDEADSGDFFLFLWQTHFVNAGKEISRLGPRSSVMMDRQPRCLTFRRMNESRHQLLFLWRWHKNSNRQSFVLLFTFVSHFPSLFHFLFLLLNFSSFSTTLSSPYSVTFPAWLSTFLLTFLFIFFLIFISAWPWLAAHRHHIVVEIEKGQQQHHHTSLLQVTNTTNKL